MATACEEAYGFQISSITMYGGEETTTWPYPTTVALLTAKRGSNERKSCDVIQATAAMITATKQVINHFTDKRLTRIRLRVAICFCLHRGSLSENTAGWQAYFRARIMPDKISLAICPDEIGGRWLHRCLCLLIVALAITNPDYKIPDADECEQRSEETPNENPAPLAEHAVDDQSQPTQRDVPVATDAPIIESRNRPEKERANQLSPPPCLQELPEIIHRKVSSVYLSRIGWQFVIYFCLHKGSLPENTAGRQSRLGAKNPRHQKLL